MTESSLRGSKQDQVDVSATKEALQEREARLRSILETAPDAIIVIDERGIMESYSQAAERLFGYRADEALGQNVSILMPSPYRERHDSYSTTTSRPASGGSSGSAGSWSAVARTAAPFPWSWRSARRW